MKAFFISKVPKTGKETILDREYEVFLEKILKLTFNHVFLEDFNNYIMKQLHYFGLLLILSVAITFASCSDDDDKGTNVGITNHSWREGKALEISMDHSVSVTFNASADWTASSSSTWCNLSASSGKAGANTLRLSVNSASTTDRTATVTLKVTGYSPANFEVTQKGSSQTVTEDMEVNEQVDKYLREKYLWNEEYKTLELDFTKNYEDFFYDALGSMTTNTLDKRSYIGNDGKTYYTIFSYIEKRNPVSTTRTNKPIEKELTYSFGITGITAVTIGDESDHTTYFCIQGVYPDSPAAEVGIKRGSMISRINGNLITASNINDYYFSLLAPLSSFNLKLKEENVKEGTERTVELTSQAMYCNPVILNKVDEINGRRIGYLVYSSFDASFDQELFDAFKGFKGKIDDLIIDLRYNGGGHTISANLIATCIAGKASQGKVFAAYRYNAERMKKQNDKKDEELFAYSNYSNLGTSLSAGSLDLPRIYCLVGNGTASASELVINALKGIGMEVILIGEQTTGKNVGMEYTDLTVKDVTYRLAPITFQTYNAKGFGDYEKGFTPDIIMDETNPDNQQGVFLIHREYGVDNEPLYAKAVELITGRKPSTTRSAANTFNGKVRPMPAVYRPGHDGMLKKFEE